jgi:hypothetical protein
MSIKYVIASILLLSIQGCSYNTYTTELSEPIVRKSPEHRFTSEFDVRPEGVQEASIGSELFRISRYEIGEYEFVRVKALTSETFPAIADWKGTHVYNDGKSGDLVVYTTPKYYRGAIGVILDSEDRIVSKAPLVQLNGMKKGRRLKLSGEGKFFEISNKLIERWGLRYGGLSDNNYVFELFNKNDANVVEIIQSIQVTEKSFLDGFTVRGVFIKGLKKDTQGVITYKVYDRLISGS